MLLSNSTLISTLQDGNLYFPNQKARGLDVDESLDAEESKSVNPGSEGSKDSNRYCLILLLLIMAGQQLTMSDLLLLL